jgi:hypothetical protein
VKIGIITYSRALNYGALFQAYGLMTFLKDAGHDVEIVDYWPEYHREEYLFFSPKLFKLRNFLSKGKHITELFIGYSRINKRRKGYFNFMSNKLGLEYLPQYLLGSEVTKSYDVVVYGSDQIWRNMTYPYFKGFDYVYFGEHLPNARRKVSYAASMGIVALSKSDEEKLKKLLKNFDSLSVREQDLQLAIKSLGFNSQLVLDPVFLLSKQSWSKIFKPYAIKEKYVLLYEVSPSKKAFEFAKAIADEKGLKLKVVFAKVKPFFIANIFLQTASPEEFLSLMYNAEFVVTTSFHGTAFSVLFNKQFYALGMGKNSQRTRTLLGIIDIENRYLDDPKSADFSDKIDYHIVQKKLDVMVNESKIFIEKKILQTQ